MNRSSRAESYEKITNQILALLDQGVLPWKQPWASILPQSVRGRTYRGLNLLILSMQSYSDPRWVTFNHVKELGGSVRKGERATWISFWQQVEREERNGDKKSFPLMRPYAVFNIAQCEGLELQPLKTELCDGTPIERAEEVIRNLPWDLTIKTGSAAYWSPSDPNSVTMPAPKSFESMDAFYSTLFHEVAHATGHSTRLSRDMSGHFGEETYGFEELVAQFTAAFVCAQIGIDGTSQEDASYVGGWAKTLRDSPKMILKAAGQAQRAADFILGAGLVSNEQEKVA